LLTLKLEQKEIICFFVWAVVFAVVFWHYDGRIKMSHIVDRLYKIRRSGVAPMGFRPVSAPTKESMLLIAGMDGMAEVKDVKALSGGGADALLIFNPGDDKEKLCRLVKAAGAVPAGMFVRGGREETLVVGDIGCDFVALDFKSSASWLSNKDMGRFLVVEFSLDRNLPESLAGLDIDGVIVDSSGEQLCTVAQAIFCQRLSCLSDKALLVILPSSISGGELDCLWQAGVDGVIVPPGESAEDVLKLKKMIDALPARAKRGKGAVEVKLPYCGRAALEKDEEEEDSLS
jgi:hypothetical protein